MQKVAAGFLPLRLLIVDRRFCPMAQDFLSRFEGVLFARTRYAIAVSASLFV